MYYAPSGLEFALEGYFLANYAHSGLGFAWEGRISIELRPFPLQSLDWFGMELYLSNCAH